MPGLDILAKAPVILVLGDRKVGKRSLVSGLPGISIDSSESVAALDIDTKYYTATARVQVHGGRNATPTADDISGCEALIIVFDATKEATFQYVKDWTRGDGAPEAEIRLCVANKADQLIENGKIVRPAWLEEVYDWCTAELLEYVEVSATDSELDRGLEFNGERQGVQRVLAALQAHMWPGLVRKEAGAGPVREYSQAPSQSPANHPLAEQEATSLCVEEGESGQLPGSETAVRQAEAAGRGEDGLPRTDEELEADMDNFESLMREVAGARDRLQGLPDSERRTAAEALTMRLMSQFGIGDDSDTNSDD